MKVIDLLNKISNQEPVPNKILVDGKYFYWDSVEMFYQTEGKQDLLEVGKLYSTWDFLNFTVIEDEEIDIDSIEELNDTSYSKHFIGEDREYYHNLTRSTLNEVIKGLKWVNKKIKEKE